MCLILSIFLLLNQVSRISMVLFFDFCLTTYNNSNESNKYINSNITEFPYHYFRILTQ